MDETNLLSLIRPWLDNICQITTKRTTVVFCKNFSSKPALGRCGCLYILLRVHRCLRPPRSMPPPATLPILECRGSMPVTIFCSGMHDHLILGVFFFLRITQVDAQHVRTLTPYEYIYANPTLWAPPKNCISTSPTTTESTTMLNPRINSEKYEHPCKLEDLNPDDLT
jgi:hypothetical protein